MNRFFPGPLPDHARNVMRRLGYGEQVARDGQISFNRRLSGGPFPKYHAYVENRDGGMQVNLHVDQKAASYEGGHAHSGEYEGPLVESEMAHIAATLASMKRQSQAGREDNAPRRTVKKDGFWGSLFG